MVLRVFATFLFIHFHILASGEIFKVKDPKSVQIVQGRDTYYLVPGDKFEVQEVDGWKRHIRIIKSLNPNIILGPAIIGEKTIAEHRAARRITKVNDSSNLRRVRETIYVETSEGRRIRLSPGDEILIKERDGWKRGIEIVTSKEYRGSAIIGDTTLYEYENSGVLTLTEEGMIQKRQRTIDDVVRDIMENKPVTDEELETAAKVQENACPKVGQSYQLERSISVLETRKVIPKGSIVKVTNGEKKCQLKLLKLADESTYSLSDFPNTMNTYPLNLSEDNITAVRDPAQTISLKKGVQFRLADGIAINAIGRNTGRSYTLEPTDKITLVGVHNNGDYIIKRNGERWEYRVDPDDLRGLNNQGELVIDMEQTVVTTITDNDVEEELVGQVDCNVKSIEGSDYSGDISFQSCRASGPKKNDYMDKELSFSPAQQRAVLDDPRKKNFAYCISKSLRHGTNRNTNPPCNGNHRIRPKNSSKLLHRVPRACASKELSTYLSERFVNAADCLGVDPKELFPIINHESHFQPKTISHTFAVGIGQTVSSNYLDFYNKLVKVKGYKSSSNLMKTAKGYQSEAGYADYENLPSSKKQLDRMSTYIISDLHSKMTGNKKSCEGLRRMYNEPFKVPKGANGLHYMKERENKRVCSPRNPDEGLFLAGIYYLQNKKYYKYLLGKKARGISNQQKDDFAAILSQYAYNGGVRGIAAPFERLLEKISEGKIEKLNKDNEPVRNSAGKMQYRKISSVSDLSASEFKRYMSYISRYRYKAKSETRREEVAKYVVGDNGVGGVDGDLKQIEKGESGLCGKSY